MLEKVEKKIGILGVGNLLLMDEGFGVHVIRHLKERYRFPDNVSVLDGGTAGMLLVPFFEEVDHALVIDAVCLDSPPGTIRLFNWRNMRAGEIRMRMSPHQIGLLDVLDICALKGCAPDEVEFIGVVPEDVSTGVGLSPNLAVKVAAVAEMVRDGLAAMGHAPAGAAGGRGA